MIVYFVHFVQFSPTLLSPLENYFTFYTAYGGTRYCVSIYSVGCQVSIFEAYDGKHSSCNWTANERRRHRVHMKEEGSIYAVTRDGGGWSEWIGRDSIKSSSNTTILLLFEQRFVLENRFRVQRFNCLEINSRVSIINATLIL